MRRVTAELNYGRGIVAGHNAVEDIMHQLGLKGLPRRRLPRGAKLRAVTSLDLVRREFKRERPNELWVTDITEHPTREGKVYCGVVLDTFSRKVVGWSIDSIQDTKLVLNALGMADRTPFIGPPVVRAGGWLVTLWYGCRLRRTERSRSDRGVRRWRARLGGRSPSPF